MTWAGDSSFSVGSNSIKERLRPQDFAGLTTTRDYSQRRYFVGFSTDSLQTLGPNHVMTVVLPEFLPARWWQQILHNQTALLIKGTFLFRKNVVITDVPHHLNH